MKDPEFAQAQADLAPSESKVRRNFAPKRVLTLISVVCGLAAIMFGIGMLASYFERSVNSKDELTHSGTAFNEKTELGHQIVPRDGGDHGFVALETITAAIVDRAEATSATRAPDEASLKSGEGVRIPISTHTDLETFYSISIIEKTTTSTSTSVEAITVTSTSDADEDECSVEIVTETKTAIVTITLYPTTSPDDQATVTGKPSTITNVQTDVSYTSGLPDVTVSGNPSTVTDVKTDISVTEGLPDVTVSGTPSTVTEVGVSYSLTTSVISGPGSSKVTVVVTDLWGTESTTTTKTVSATSEKTYTTTLTSTTPVVVTVSDLYPPPDESSVENTSLAKGGAWPGTSSSEPPYPTNGTTVVYPSGTVTVVPGPTTPPIVSGGTKKPEPRGLGGGNGSSHLGCTMMIIAVVMFML